MSNPQPQAAPSWLDTYLIDGWRDAHHFWSLRLLALSILLTGIEFILPIFMENPPIPRGLFAGFAFLISIGAGIARLVAQKEVAR